MRIAGFLAAACLGAAAGASALIGQQPAAQPALNQPACRCGLHPPGPERAWTANPYANTPEDMRPYGKFVTPYYFNYLQPTIWNGPGRDQPEPKGLTEVRIGFAGPTDPRDPDYGFGMRMLHGAEMAVDEANARGGYNGLSYRLVVHGDYNNWQAGAVAGPYRPTDPDIWGAAADTAVRMIYDDKVWAIFGSISSESTHIMLRVALKAEIPIVNSASTDPTIPETSIPWYFTDLQDDRVQCYTLARRIYTELGLKRVAILRVNNRYGRMGVPKFRDASRRLGHPVAVEQKFFPGTTDFSRQLRVIQESRADAILLWTDEAPAAAILKQMRALGMKQRVFGSYRTLGPELLAQAGPAAEGFEAVYPFDPSRKDARWLDFVNRYQARFHQQPEQFAPLAYDAMNILLDAICQAGLNRVRIQDALDNVRQYDGVTGRMVFDPNQKDVAPMYLGTVHNGSITYRLATMKEPEAKPTPHPLAQNTPPAPYARMNASDVSYAGPRRPNLPAGPIVVALFGPDAEKIAQSPSMRAALVGAHGREWKLVPVGSDVRWSSADWPVWAASSQLVQAMTSRHALAAIALNTDAGHLAEQLSLKCFLPVVALSDDRALTSVNVPWIFRLPAATAPAAALRLLVDAEAAGGANPQAVREELASGRALDSFAFQPNGELR